MMRIQCLLALAALSVGLAHSWDLAVTIGDKLEFYNNNTKSIGEGVSMPDSEFSPLTYDPVHNMLYFATKKDKNTYIHSYNLLTQEQKVLDTSALDIKILGFAYDPVSEILFYTTNIPDRKIHWVSNNGSVGVFKNVTADENPCGIAVDSCRGYVYWTNCNIVKPSINRARFDGSEREVIVDTNMYLPVSIVVDQQTKKIYWADDKQGMHYSIESAGLDGKNRQVLHERGDRQEPMALTVSKDSILWMDKYHDVVWKMAKNPPKDILREYIKYPNGEGHGIVANYRIEDQIRDQDECEALRKLIRSNAVPKDVVTEKPENSTCNCLPEDSTEIMASTVCLNYCFKGGCTVTLEGIPKCSCDAGYTGDRCEVNICAGHCLNEGICSWNELNEPLCKCSEDFEGTRCETRKIVPTTEATPVCNCTETQEAIVPQHASPSTQEMSTKPVDTTEKAPENGTKIVDPKGNAPNATKLVDPAESFVQNVDDIIATCSGGWDPVRDPVIMALGVLVGVLCLFCGLLITKVLQLKRRPRIKKRIIVNKNVTPMTARPDQCEITIENCCNMNICETPCFEPRSTIRPSLLDCKPGKEEKKNLISNMEYPDDY